MLPFDLEIENPERDLKIGSLVIPSYGSFTPNESRALDKAEINPDLPSAFWYVDALAIIFASRHECTLEWAKEQLANLPSHLLEDGYSWLKNEANRWATPEPNESAQKKTLNPTGQASIGASNSDIPTSPDSILEISGIAPFT